MSELGPNSEIDRPSGAGEDQPPAVGDSPAAQIADETPSRTSERANMLPRRGRRRFGVERLLMRLIATAGIVGIGVAIAAIMAASKSQGWVTGLVVALVTVVLSAVLWSSRQL